MAPKAHRHPDIDDVELVTVLSALAEPTRLRIVHMLAEAGTDPGSGAEPGDGSGADATADPDGREGGARHGSPAGLEGREVPAGAEGPTGREGSAGSASLPSHGSGAGRERAWKDLDLPIAQSTLSHHLRILREAGLLRNRTEGTRCFVSLRTDELDARFPGLLRTVLTCTDR